MADNPAEKAARALDQAVTNVAHSAAEVVASAEQRRGCTTWIVGHDEMADLREAIETWTKAGETFLRLLQDNPIPPTVRVVPDAQE